MVKNFSNPPLTDRGVQNTSPLINWEKNILVDWFECTVKGVVDPYIIFCSYLKIPRSEVQEENKGLYCYNYTYYWRDIKIMTSSSNKDFGTHILMSGRGCRDFESLFCNWLEFFSFLRDNFDFKVTRIDIAIDTFTDKYFTMQKLRDYIKNKQVVSRFKSSTEFIQKSLSSSEVESETIWFGSRTSNIQIVFYNKKMERINASYEVDKNIEFWYRCELRFRNEVAMNLIDVILSQGNYIECINNVLYNYLDFKDYNANESNRSRWNTSSWWLDFLKSNEKLSLKVNVKESSIIRKQRWLKDSVSKSEFMVYISDIIKDENYSIDLFSSNYLYVLLRDGYSKITSKDLQMINEYRLKNGFQLLEMSDLEDIMHWLSKIILSNSP